MTDQQLYLAVEDIVQRHKSSSRSLEQYLTALLGLARQHSDLGSLPVHLFIQLLAEAFIAEPLPFDDSWRALPAPLNAEPLGFAEWEAELISQIVDLREMDESNILKNKYKSFGVAAPRGSNWYNFEPADYLECGTAGLIDGWPPESSTEQILVTGTVGLLDADGKTVKVNAEDVALPVFDILELSWEQFFKFIACGKYYE
jgi:hypothetical protein